MNPEFVQNFIGNVKYFVSLAVVCSAMVAIMWLVVYAIDPQLFATEGDDFAEDGSYKVSYFFKTVGGWLERAGERKGVYFYTLYIETAMVAVAAMVTSLTVMFIRYGANVIEWTLYSVVSIVVAVAVVYWLEAVLPVFIAKHKDGWRVNSLLDFIDHRYHVFLYGRPLYGEGESSRMIVENGRIGWVENRKRGEIPPNAYSSRHGWVQQPDTRIVKWNKNTIDEEREIEAAFMAQSGAY